MMRSMTLFCVGLALACSCSGTNHPPNVVPLGALTVVVGDSLAIDLWASDPDGDRVTFSVEGAPEGAFVDNPETPPSRFVYSPLASDAVTGGRPYNLVFRAIDANGGQTDQAVVLTVWPEGSVPTFAGPFMWTLNLALADHITAPIKVRDDDTATLTFTLHRGIEDARFEVVDGNTASVFWKPNPLQIEQGPVFTFSVGVSDGVHPEIVSDFAVVLINADLFGGCPGTAPTASMPLLSDAGGSEDYPLLVNAWDAESAISRVLCRWSATADVSDEDMNPVELVENLDGRWMGTIPNLSAAAGNGRLLYYHCIVADSDDPNSDYCDHRTRLPKNGQNAFAFYGPTSSTGCLEDVLHPNHDDGHAAPLPGASTDSLRLCGGLPDVFAVELTAGGGLAVQTRAMSLAQGLAMEIRDPNGTLLASGRDRVTAMAALDGRHTVIVAPPDSRALTYELSSTLLESRCPLDIYEPNDEAAQASTLAEGSTQATICPADEDYWEVSLSSGKGMDLALSFDPSKADLDLLVYRDDEEFPLAISAGTSGTERVIVEATVPRSYIARVVSNGLVQVPYFLDLRVEGQGGICSEDLFSPNATTNEAPTVPEGVWEKLKLCPGKPDFLRWGLNGGEDVMVQVQVDSSADLPGLLVLDEDGASVLASGMPDGAMTTASFRKNGPGNVFIQVGPITGASLNYTLDFGATDPAGACTSDRFEPNDGLDMATPIPRDLLTHLTLCDGDTDLFALRLGAWESVSAYVLEGTVLPHLTFMDAAGEVQAEGLPESYGEEILFVAAVEGTYYLSARQPAGLVGWYDIGVDPQ